MLLENAGHYPLEQPGIDQLHAAMAGFVRGVVADNTAAPVAAAAAAA